jgi:hypothetical protein
MSAWWTAQDAGLVGGLGGAAIGLVGALVGSLSFLVVRGKAKPLMVGLFGAMIALGLALLGAGVIALTQSQPYHVYYPLLLGGFLSTCLFGALLPVILMRYRQAEVRRMEAEQLRRS